MTVFLRFLLVGASGVLVNLGVFALLLRAGLSPYLASPLAIETSIVSNFLLHERWTFRGRRRPGPAHVRGLWFNAASLATLALSYATFVLWTLVVPQWPSVVHQLLAIPAATLVNFFVNSRWIFRHRPAER